MTPTGSYLNARSPDYGAILKTGAFIMWGVGGGSRPPRGGALRMQPPWIEAFFSASGLLPREESLHVPASSAAMD